MENNSSAFQLNQYRIESVQVTQNKSFNRELSERSGSVTASVNIAQNKKDDRKYRLTLNIDLNPTEEGGEEKFFPYYINIKGQGFFCFQKPCPPKQANHVLSRNGAAILYGLLRGQIAQITAQSVYGQFLLPILDFVAIQKEAAENQTAED